MKTEKISKALNWIMIALFSVLIAIGPLLAVFEKRELLFPFMGGLVLAAGIYFILPLIRVKKVHPTILTIILSVLCFIVKFIWIYMVRIEPMVDYQTYFDYAKTLSESFSAPNNYIALFPHVFGYSWFLSFFMKIFGTGELLAPVINVIFSVISGVLIFRIAYRLIDIRAAVFAYLLWIFCPSQTIYNSLVLSDLFYTTMILAFVLIITEMNLSSCVKHTALLGVLAGFILRLVNITRPIAAILIIAVIIWLGVLKAKEWTNSDFRKKWSPFLILLVICYFVTEPIWDIYTEKRLGEKPAGAPGYNVMVGFNMDSYGAWNAEDSALLVEYSQAPDATAVSTQEQMLKDAKERITSGTINFPKLFANKFVTFLGYDSSAVFYHLDVLNDSVKSLENLSNIFYYMLVILAVIASPALGKQTAISTVPLYVIGLTIAQMLVEVAGRYHYSIIPMLILAAQFGIFRKAKE